jgi:hypothetical protein
MKSSGASDRTIGIVETISSGLSAVQAWAPNGAELWFRGHSDAKFELLPSVFRQGSGWDVAIDEAGLFRDFGREFPERRNEHRSEFEWLTLMQHYSIPTRLLDWTTSFLVALHFAVNEDLGHDGTICVLNPTHIWADSANALTPLLTTQIDCHDWQGLVLGLAAAARKSLPGVVRLNGIDCGSLDFDPFQQVKVMNSPPEIRSLSYRHRTSQFLDLGTGALCEEVEQELIRHLSVAIAIRPPKLNPRLIAQHGMFTFHGGKFIDGHAAIPAPPLDELLGKDSLSALVVPGSAKLKLAHELRRAGIYEAALFPEMEYKAREIRARRTRKLASK